MLIAPELRDIRDERKWHKHWIDRPGMGWFWCCCPTTPCCDNTNGCATLQFSDDFSSAKAGYTDANCATGDTFAVGGGFLTETFGAGSTPKYNGASGTHTQSITIPALNGLCISVSVQIYKVSGKVAGVTGMTINGVGTMVGRIGSSTQYGTQNTTAANGCIGGGGTNHFYGAALTDFVDGDCLCLVLQDTSSGGGTYSLKSYVNGTLLDTFAGLAKTLTAGGSIKIGVVDTNGGQWDNLCIATS